VVAALTIGAVLLLAMVAAAAYAIRTLPAGARVPLNAGMPEYSVWLPKPAGLAAWLGIGAVAFAAFAALTAGGLAANWAQSLRVVLLPGVMLVVLAAEAGAVIVARRTAAEQLAGEQPAAEALAAEGPAAEASPAPAASENG